LRPVRDNRARFSRVTGLGDLVRILTLFGAVLFSLHAGLRGVLSLPGQPSPPGSRPTGPPAGQLDRQFITSPASSDSARTIRS
jgi:hypothetical protein